MKVIEKFGIEPYVSGHTTRECPKQKFIYGEMVSLNALDLYCMINRCKLEMLGIHDFVGQ